MHLKGIQLEHLICTNTNFMLLGYVSSLYNLKTQLST